MFDLRCTDVGGRVDPCHLVFSCNPGAFFYKGVVLLHMKSILKGNKRLSSEPPKAETQVTGTAESPSTSNGPTLVQMGRARRTEGTVPVPVNRVSLEDFEILKVIGKGSFGKIFLVKKKSDGKVRPTLLFLPDKAYAMKMLQKNMLAMRGEIEHTLSEKAVMSRLSNPFIAKLHYSFQNGEED